ncbi:MAG: hypothetical protein HYZ15_04125, partial [Sphingobacteriales bacterium]|nr:hypothetical protein [Sphingobacteriales bacterium]
MMYFCKICQTTGLPAALVLLFPAFLFGQTSGYSGTGSNIDVTYHRCEWRINPDSASKGIKGTVTTYFVT